MFFCAATGAQKVYYLEGSTQKIEQLVGDYDRERQTPTKNQTFSKYQIWGTDLGASFRHKDKTYFLFGDIPGDIGFGVDRDPIAYTVDNKPEDGLELTFLTQSPGLYQPITIPGISQGAFEVPVAGLSIGGIMYIYLISEGKSVLARSLDDGKSFQLIEDEVTSQYFINVSVSKVDRNDYPNLPGNDEQGILVFGTGAYRESAIYLYYQAQNEIENKNSIYFFAGFNGNSPVWSKKEIDAQPIIQADCVGELSAAFNSQLEKWTILYNCDNPRGINLRTADLPWGGYSAPEIIFEPWRDSAYCHYIHTAWNYMNCDSVHDQGRADEWGGEYGPYLLNDMSIQKDSLVTIYYTMSTWNPYSVLLMKSTLVKSDLVSSVSTGIDKKSFNVFPNPTSSNISLVVPDQYLGEFEVLIYNGAGREVLRVKNSTELNLNSLASGFYFGQFFYRGAPTFPFRLVKQ